MGYQGVHKRPALPPRRGLRHRGMCSLLKPWAGKAISCVCVSSCLLLSSVNGTVRHVTVSHERPVVIGSSRNQDSRLVVHIHRFLVPLLPVQCVTQPEERRRNHFFVLHEGDRLDEISESSFSFIQAAGSTGGHVEFEMDAGQREL